MRIDPCSNVNSITRNPSVCPPLPRRPRRETPSRIPEAAVLRERNDCFPQRTRWGRRTRLFIRFLIAPTPVRKPGIFFFGGPLVRGLVSGAGQFGMGRGSVDTPTWPRRVWRDPGRGRASTRAPPCVQQQEVRPCALRSQRPQRSMRAVVKGCTLPRWLPMLVLGNQPRRMGRRSPWLLPGARSSLLPHFAPPRCQLRSNCDVSKRCGRAKANHSSI